MDPKPRRQQPQAPLTRVFSALAFRLAAISDSARELLSALGRPRGRD
jgi:hypothetical protein